MSLPSRDTLLPREQASSDAAERERCELDRSEWVSGSLGGDAELDVGLGLLLRERAEEINLFLAGRLPLVVRLKRALQVRLDVHVERLRLQLRIRRVVHARHRLRRC